MRMRAVALAVLAGRGREHGGGNGASPAGRTRRSTSRPNQAAPRAIVPALHDDGGASESDSEESSGYSSVSSASLMGGHDDGDELL